MRESRRVEYYVVEFIVIMDERCFLRWWHVFLHPWSELLDLWNFMGLRTVVAFDPAADLALDVALRLAQISKADRRIVEAVQPSQIVKKRVAHLARRGRRKREAQRRISAKNDPLDGFHYIKGSAQHGIIVAVAEHLGRWRVCPMKLGENAKLSSHVVRGLDLAAEGRPTQNHLSVTELDEIRKIRMATRKLLDDERFRLERKMVAQERFKFKGVKLLSRPNGTRFVTEVPHFRMLCLHVR